MKMAWRLIASAANWQNTPASGRVSQPATGLQPRRTAGTPLIPHTPKSPPELFSDLEE
jgi:hypothetical protein